MEQAGEKKKEKRTRRIKADRLADLVLEHEKELRANLPFRVLADRRPVGFRRFDGFHGVGERFTLIMAEERGVEVFDRGCK